jgi:hypothetical protein
MASPAQSPGRVLMGAHGRGVDADERPVDLSDRVAVLLDMGQKPRPGAVRRPAAEPFIHRFPGPVSLREIPPGRPGRQLPQNPVHHLPAVPDRPAHPRSRQQRLQNGPGLIGQLMTTHHDLPSRNPLCGHALGPSHVGGDRFPRSWRTAWCLRPHFGAVGWDPCGGGGHGSRAA